MRKSELQEIIKELIKQELDEVSVTGNIDGGEGPPRTPMWVSKIHHLRLVVERKKIKKRKRKILQIVLVTK